MRISDLSSDVCSSDLHPPMWSSRARLMFLLPAVLWVAVFTIFPLGYSLVMSLASLETRVEVTRERVPVVDDAGDPVLSSSGKPRMRTQVQRETMSTWTFAGLSNFARLRSEEHTSELQSLM